MKFLIVLSISLAASSLLADSNASYPPNPWEDRGGKRAPAFSEANSEAMHFLNITDNQQYGGSWLDAAGLFKDVISQAQWIGAMRETRLPLGTVRARRVSSHHAAHELPGGTRGEFMIIEFDTQFSTDPNGVEIVTLMREAPLGLWRVISYKIGKR